MTTSKELNLAKDNLVASLGDANAKVYFERMKQWFQMKTSKEEFDSEARSLMTEDQVRLHNEFLLCIFNKVRGLATVTPIPKVDRDRDRNSKEKKLTGLKRKYKTDKSNFEPADMYVEVLDQTTALAREEPTGANRSSAQELLLPDRPFVLARLMLAAWEHGLDDAEESTAHIVIVATQMFLKNILTAVFTRRKGYATRDNSFIYNIGEPVPSSWKRNSVYLNSLNSGPTEIMEHYGQIPVAKPTVEEAEQATAFSYACSTQVLRPLLKPVNIADLQYTLKIYKNLVSNHTLYATNMERLFTYATHPTWEDLEARKLLCQSST